MWAAAVAAVGMCVRKNLDGVATIQGRSNLFNPYVEECY